MKSCLILLSTSIHSIMITSAQSKTISTGIGDIAVHINVNPSENTPIIFLHGVYFDHHLWDKQTEAINDRTVITVDMPLHGESISNVPKKWTLNDCADMLITILDSLHMNKVIAVGHSWGSMTILRAASKHPERFQSIGFCNMPFKEMPKAQKMMFNMQHSMLIFKNFYMNVTGKVALFSKESVKQHPELLDFLKASMSKLSNADIRRIDKYVVTGADDATELIKSLKVNALALKGKDDYVPIPDPIKTTIVNGGHASPIESPDDVIAFCLKLF